MYIFNPSKRRLMVQFKDAFPEEYQNDVLFVCAKIAWKESHWRYPHMNGFEDATEWTLSTGETIKIPYRLYLRDMFPLWERLFSPTQRIIYHCLYSRSCDGYRREKHIKALLALDIPEWAMPYVIKICDEYIIEILELVYQHLSKTNCESYKRLCALNFDYIKIGHSRMISYWNVFYRDVCYRYTDYIGKRLYGECFGYRKTGQKSIL